MRILMVSLVMLLLVGCQPQEVAPAVKDTLGDPVYQLDGTEVNFADLQGRWVVINYWATWCEPCVVEIPELNAFYQANRDQVIVYGVNNFEGLDREGIREAADHFDITYPLLANDPTPKFGVGDIVVLPTTIIIDPQGHVIDKRVGEQTQAGLEELIKISP